MTPEQATLILKLVRLSLFALAKAPEVRLELQRLTDELAAMVAEGRNPNAQELAALETRLDNAHHALSF